MFSTSSVQFELRLALSLIITTHPRTPGKVEMQLEMDHIWPVGSCGIVCLVIFRLQGVDLSGIGDPPQPRNVYLEFEIDKV